MSDIVLPAYFFFSTQKNKTLTTQRAQESTGKKNYNNMIPRYFPGLETD
jgi:hypothetical protein